MHIVTPDSGSILLAIDCSTRTWTWWKSAFVNEQLKVLTLPYSSTVVNSGISAFYLSFRIPPLQDHWYGFNLSCQTDCFEIDARVYTVVLCLTFCEWLLPKEQSLVSTNLSGVDCFDLQLRNICCSISSPSLGSWGVRNETCQRWSQVKAAGGLSRTCRTPAPQMFTSWCHVWHVNYLCARMVGELAGVRDLSLFPRNNKSQTDQADAKRLSQKLDWASQHEDARSSCSARCSEVMAKIGGRTFGPPDSFAELTGWHLLTSSCRLSTHLNLSQRVSTCINLYQLVGTTIINRYQLISA